MRRSRRFECIFHRHDKWKVAQSRLQLVQPMYPELQPNPVRRFHQQTASPSVQTNMLPTVSHWTAVGRPAFTAELFLVNSGPDDATAASISARTLTLPSFGFLVATAGATLHADTDTATQMRMGARPPVLEITASSLSQTDTCAPFLLRQ